MPDASFLQSSFLGGEWSPNYQGRADNPKYSTAMNVCYNAVILEEGAWTRRPGTRYGAHTRNGAPARVMAFAFEAQSPYYLEFTDGHLRFFNGPTLVTEPTGALVTSIAAATPAQITLATPVNWATGDQIVFQFPASGVAQSAGYGLKARQFALTKIDATHFTLADPISGAGVNGAAFNISSLPVPNIVKAARIVDLPTPYTAGSWANLRIVQSGLQAYLLCPGVAPQLLAATLGASVTFSLAAAAFVDGPYLDPVLDPVTNQPTTSFIVQKNADGSFNITVSGWSGQFVVEDIGRHFRLLPAPANWVSGQAYGAGTMVIGPLGGYWASTGSAGGGWSIPPESNPTAWSTVADTGPWSWGIVTAVRTPNVVQIQFMGGNLGIYSGGQYWQLGAFGGAAKTFPTCGCYHEGRLWLGGAISNRFDGSMSNLTNVFSPTTEAGAVNNNNAISYTFDSDSVNPIYWMSPDHSGILAGTLEGEWLIEASALNNPLTPANIQAHRITKYGSANVEPRRTGLTLAVVHRFKRKLLEYFADVFTNRYVAPNLSEAAKHMTLTGVQEIAYQQEIAPLLWARMADGSLAAATYRRQSLFSSQPADFVGWHRHDMGDGHFVTSIAVGPSTDGTIDTLAMVEYDPANAAIGYHVTFLTDIFDVDSAITDAWQADDAMAPAGGTLSGNTLNFYGLYHLAGETVTAWIGGVDAGDWTVAADGSVAVTIGTGPSDLLTPAVLASLSASGTNFGQAATTVDVAGVGTKYTIPAVIGYNFVSQGQGLRPLLPQQTGTPAGPALGKTRRVHRYALLVQAAQGLSVGTNFTSLRSVLFRSPGGKPYALNQLYSGVHRAELEDAYSYDGMLAWQVSRPYPATVNAAESFLQTQEP